VTTNSAAQFCAATSLLVESASSTVNVLLRKLYALQRIAAVLEDAGNITPTLNLDGLLPLSQLAYESAGILDAIGQTCGVGALSGFSGDIRAFESAIGQAYQSFYQNLTNHPFYKLTQLQAVFDNAARSAAAEIAKTLNPGVKILDCINSICQASQLLGVYSAQELSAQQAKYEALTDAQWSLLNSKQQAGAAVIVGQRAKLVQLITT